MLWTRGGQSQHRAVTTSVNYLHHNNQFATEQTTNNTNQHKQTYNTCWRTICTNTIHNTVPVAPTEEVLPSDMEHVVDGGTNDGAQDVGTPTPATKSSVNNLHNYCAQVHGVSVYTDRQPTGSSTTTKTRNCDDTEPSTRVAIIECSSRHEPLRQ